MPILIAGFCKLRKLKTVNTTKLYCTSECIIKLFYIFQYAGSLFYTSGCVKVHKDAHFSFQVDNSVNILA